MPKTPVANDKRLRAVGPIDPVHGFPLWYEDHTGTKLELGVGGADPYLPAVDPTPMPGKPLNVPDNFPEEAFYFLAEARIDLGGPGKGARARLVLALEAAFGGPGVPDASARVVFARIRGRMDDVVPGNRYEITHPYGVTVATADEGGRVFVTDDRGIADQLFDRVVRDGGVAPFLTWASGAPDGYIGNGVDERPVTGSPFGTNYFRVGGTDIGAYGGPRDPADPGNVNVVYTDLFTVQGKKATRQGVTLDRASYSRTSAGAVTLAVHATATAGQELALDVPAVPLVGTGPRYVAHATLDAVPTLATVVNTSDNPATRSTLPVSDLVVVSDAVWDAASGELTVLAASSDATGVTLSLEPNTPLDVPIVVAAPPATVVVTSSGGGTGSAPVRVVGPAAASLGPVARTVLTQEVAATLPVTLDGSASTGATAWTWTQTSGTPVALDVQGATATFTAQFPETLGFRLTVTGPGGTASEDVTVTVNPPPPPDQLRVQSSQYRTDRRQFRIKGSCVGVLPNVVSVSYAGILLGTVPVDVTHAWSVVATLPGEGPVKPDPPAPPAGVATVTVTSGHGVTTTAPIDIRH